MRELGAEMPLPSFQESLPKGYFYFSFAFVTIVIKRVFRTCARFHIILGVKRWIQNKRKNYLVKLLSILVL